MAKPDWGVKRTCQSCAIKFYDFGRTPIVCPKCGTSFDPETVLRSRRGRANAAAKPAKPAQEDKAAATPAAAVANDEEGLNVDLAEDDLDDEDEDDGMIEDASELGEDDDMSDVVVGGEEDDD